MSHDRAEPNSWWLVLLLPMAAIMVVVTAIPAAIGIAWDVVFGRGEFKKELEEHWNDSGNPRFPRG